MRSASVLTITTGSFGGLCTATLVTSGGADVICTTTAVGTKFPWVATVPTASNVTIHGIHIDVTFENTPANNGCALGGANGLSLTLTGTLGGGTFDNREIIYDNDEGLVSHNSLLGNNRQVTARGTFTSTQNLTVTG